MAYAFEKLPQLVNLRGELVHNGWYSNPPIEWKTHVAIHHSLTETGDSAAFARYHVLTKGWPEVAYAFVILKDGTIEWNHRPSTFSYHVGNSNSFAVGVCLVGDFRYEDPTPEQKQSLYELMPLLIEELPNYEATWGHDEFPDYAWKACPEFDYEAVIAGNFDPMADGYLEEGESGEVVAKLQRALMTLGYDLGGYGADGNYGPATVNAVEQFQEDEGLTQDGYYGPATQAAMREALDEHKTKEQEEYNMAQTGFKDVDPDAYYAEAVRWAREEGITEGVGDNKLGVGENLKREDALVFIYRAFTDRS